ncbi:hypothetical protein KA005_18440, partial [bacterium]|nr:hypothetical protein [bacterium]
HPLDIMPFRQAVKPIFEAASMALPKDFRLIAYNTAYVERELKVCSKPDKAAVHYCRYGNKRYQKFQSLTDTNLTLEYAAWYIRVEKDKYYPDEKLFDPYVSSEWRVDFDLKPIKK